MSSNETASELCECGHPSQSHVPVQGCRAGISEDSGTKEYTKGCACTAYQPASVGERHKEQADD